MLKDKQHESVIHWMTGVVLFGIEKLLFNSNRFAFIYLFIYIFIYLLNCIDNLCLIAMFACLDYNLYNVGGGSKQMLRELVTQPHALL